MKRSTLLFCLGLVLISSTAFAQTNVRGWHKNGQVWIVWQVTHADSPQYAIYAGRTSFANTRNATLVGRLFWQEWSGLRLKDTARSDTVTYKIPTDTGDYRLRLNEGLFVGTVTSADAGTNFFAVVRWGDSLVTANNRVSVTATYSLNEPPRCYEQYRGSNQGYPFAIFNMWADGRDNDAAGRPDFPVMGNRHKHGAPHIFIVTAQPGGPPLGPLPATIFLHGGTGEEGDAGARTYLPPNASEFGLAPAEGLLITHEDRVYRERPPAPNPRALGTTWFGYYRGLDPFLPVDPLFPLIPTSSDTVINYTQRRVVWINDWLARTGVIDSTRLAVMGHSNGARGARFLMKVYPRKFSTVAMFTSLTRGRQLLILGNDTLNLPTNLRDRKGQAVRMNQLWDLTSTFAEARDLPLTRLYAGKRDLDQPDNEWDASLVGELRKEDSLSFGMHIYWDERKHGPENIVPCHWVNSTAALDQTQRDDAAYQFRYRSNQSFPAFHRHSGRPGNRDPGNGDPADGDVWGTWGGYHDWDLDTIVDEPGKWEVTAFLVGLSANTVDNFPGPGNSLTADLAIRRPQQFKPKTGKVLQWSVTRISSGQVLQSGTTTVGADDLVSITGITLFKDPDRVRIRVSDPTVAVEERNSETLPTDFSLSQNYPNPFNPSTMIGFQLPVSSHVTLKVFDVNGREVATLVNGERAAGNHSVTFAPQGGDWAGGIYFYKLTAAKFSQTRKAVLMK